MDKKAAPILPVKLATIFNPRQILNLFSQLKFAVFLMFTMAVLTLLGTVIEQKTAEEFHAQSQSQEIIYGIITFLHLNEIFHVWYFKLLLVLFAASIIAVTLTRVVPSLKYTLSLKSKTLDPEGLKALPYYQEIKGAGLDEARAVFQKRKYKLQETPVQGVYVAEKGLWSRFSALFTHVSILVMLAGILMGGLGFKGNMDLFPGQVGKVSSQADWTVKLVDFWIDHRPDGTVRQFNSVLTVLDKDGREVLTKHIWVNEPLVYQGVYFYQATYAVAGYSAKINNKEEFMEMGPLATGAGFATHAFELGGKKYVLYSPEANANIAYFLELTDQGPVEVGNFDYTGKSFAVNGQPVTFIEPVYFSGLSVKRDPGIPVIYLGFLLITISISLAFFPYKTFWIASTPRGVVLAGRANKGKYHFEKEFNDIIEDIEKSPAQASSS